MRNPTHVLALSLVGLLGLSAVAQNPPGPAGGAPPYTPPPRTGEAGRDVPPQERRADLMGRVESVSPDGRSLTLSMPPRPGPDGRPPARDAKPEQATVNLGDRTQMSFFGVGEGEARPAPGLVAMVWLEEGSRDQAARVRFMRREGDERPDVQGRVVSVSPDGRTVTVETRDGERVTGKTDVRIAPYTQSLYYGVDRDGARPTPDYMVVAWYEKGSKDTAARIRFLKADPQAQGMPPGGFGAPGGFGGPGPAGSPLPPR
jgi:hypothetical protein